VKLVLIIIPLSFLFQNCGPSMKGLPGASVGSQDNASSGVPSLVLADSVTGSRLYSARSLVNVTVSGPAADRYCLSETMSSRPSGDQDPCFTNQAPTTLALSSGEGAKNVYFWYAVSGEIRGGQPVGIMVDTVAPTLQFQGAAPSAISNQSNFVFNLNEVESGSGVANRTCTLNGVAVNPCSNPLPLNNVAEASNTLEVTIRDMAGNSGVLRHTFLVDRTVPTVQIQNTPSNPSNVQTANFTFSGMDGSGSGIDIFECRVDAAAFAACTSPHPLSGLPVGARTFDVRARDRAGNMSLVASYAWNIALNAPTVTIATGPAPLTNSSSASFTFSTTGFNLSCRLDNQAFAPCASPVGPLTVGEGPHTYQVRATDMAGMQVVTASRTWTADLTIPTYTNPAPPSTTAANVTLLITVNDAVSGVNTANPQCTRNGVSTPCSISGNTLTISLTNLADGNHSVQARVFDLAGNSVLTNAIAWTKQSTGSLNLAWDANTETDLSGYRLYYGTVPGVYLQPAGQGLSVGVSPNPTLRVANLSRGQNYYFVVRAYNSAGESLGSNEVQGMVP
jgi:hypothetical protein